MDVYDLINGCWIQLLEYADSNEEVEDICCSGCGKEFLLDDEVWQGDGENTSDWFEMNFYCYVCALDFSEDIQQEVVDKINEIQMGCNS